MERRHMLIGMMTIVVFAAFATLTRVMFNSPSFRGEIINPPSPAAEIKLTDQDGRPFQMSSLRGKVVLLYFGFVNCPEECPLTMAHLKQAVETLGPAAGDLQVVMVSTDPVRDTPQALKNFLGAFNPGFIGIPGTSIQLAKIWSDFGVDVLDGGETHSSYTYVIDRQGRQRLTLTPETLPDDIAHDLKILLSED